jgi:hypothetical protein
LNAGVLQYVRKLADFRVELLISKRTSLAGLAFPDQRRFVASPRSQVSIEAVVGNIDPAAAKPFCMRRVPLQHRIPCFEPVKFFGHSGPESFGVSRSLSTQLLELGHRLDMCELGKSL